MKKNKKKKKNFLKSKEKSFENKKNQVLFNFFVSFVITAALAFLSFVAINLLLPKKTYFSASLIPELIVKLKPDAVKNNSLKFVPPSKETKDSFGTTMPQTRKISRILPGEEKEFDFELYEDNTISKLTGLYCLKVCCPQGYVREYYTYPVDWEYILHQWSAKTPAITLFHFNKEMKQAKMLVVILKNDNKNSDIKKTDIMRFIKLMDEKIPGYSWEADVKEEM